MDHCPPHFTPVDFSLYAKEKVITDWIWEHTEGRFYIGDAISNDSAKRPMMVKRVAFEDGGEAGYFALLLDTINKR